MKNERRTMKNGEESSRYRSHKHLGSVTEAPRREKREVVATQLAQASWVASTRRHRLLLEPPGRPKLIKQALEKAVFTFSLSQSAGLASIR
ncbi:hypothetical protein GmHk_04G010741 [Glycine max]|nr:hypothetical protein GmHk_04G010741 [Glycine max]